MIQTQKKNERAPIVAILGHVDHGKTTLLDAIRKTNVAGKEAGGITQAIGASSVVTPDGKKITFIDTPGHAAFSAMRSRGAKVADVVVLVVGAEDGVKPQTEEALNIIKGENVAFIVAATKIDLPSASVEIVYSQLEKLGVTFEGRGGDTPLVPVSAKKNEGIKELLEMIALVSEMNEISGDPEGELEAVVIETSKDRSGPTASVVVRSGTLEVGKVIYTAEGECKVRGLFNAEGKSVRKILPGEAAKILGFNNMPEVGSPIHSSVFPDTSVQVTKKTFKREDKGKLGVILKAANAGALEALVASVPKDTVYIVESAVGDVLESDILNAKGSGTTIFAFEAKVPNSVLKFAETEKIEVYRFDIIYELLQKIDEVLKKGTDQITGKAEIVGIFPYEKKKVAGGKVTEGKLIKLDRIVVKRGERVLGEAKIVSLRRGKAEIPQALPGEDFGLIMEPQLDFAVGDVILSVSK